MHFFVYLCSKKVANATNSPIWKPHGRNRSTSSVKLDPIHRNGSKKKKSSNESQNEDTDEGFCSNGSSSSSTSHALISPPKVMITQATPRPSNTGTPTQDDTDQDVTTLVKELMHDVLMDVRLELTDEGIELM